MEYATLADMVDTLPVPQASAFSSVSYNKATGAVKITIGRESVLLPNEIVVDHVRDLLGVAVRETEDYRRAQDQMDLLNRSQEEQE
jgi:hypothetical protein